MTDPCRDLWCAVLLQAIEDALYGGKSVRNRSDDRMAEMVRARLFFARTSRDLITVCTLAGVDPVATRERIATQIAAAVEREAPGVGLDFVPSEGTGGGTSEQERSNLTFADRSFEHA